MDCVKLVMLFIIGHIVKWQLIIKYVYPLLSASLLGFDDYRSHLEPSTYAVEPSVTLNTSHPCYGMLMTASLV